MCIYVLFDHFIGVSPIAYAIDEDQLGAVDVLLLNGVDPNQKTTDGNFITFMEL